jgi:hypothetical protein
MIARAPDWGSSPSATPGMSSGSTGCTRWTGNALN